MINIKITTTKEKYTIKVIPVNLLDDTLEFFFPGIVTTSLNIFDAEKRENVLQQVIQLSIIFLVFFSLRRDVLQPLY